MERKYIGKYAARKSVIHNFLAALLTILFVFLISRLYTIILLSPDDISMKSIVSGLMSGTPDGHSVFMRYPLSALLAGFYRVYAKIDWYDLFFVGCNGLCIYLIFCRMNRFRGFRAVGYSVFAIVLMLALLTSNIVHMEWTATAGVLGMTAIFRYCTMPPKQTAGQQWREFLVILFLLAVGFCMRHTVVMMFIPLAFICWLKRLADIHRIKGRIDKRDWIHHIAFLLSAGMIVVLIMVSHSLAYSSDEWKAYNDYTKDRSSLVDFYGYPDYDTYAEAYAEAGMSQEMLNLMKSDYNYVIPADHYQDVDIKSLAQLAEELYNRRTASEMLEACAEDLTNLFEDPDVSWTAVTLIVLLLCNLVVIRKKRWQDYLYLAAAVLWLLAISAYLLYSGRFPVRVAQCTMYGLAAVLAGSLVEYAAKNRQRRVLSIAAVVAVCIAAVLLIPSQMDELYQKNQNQAMRATAKNQISAYCNENPENLYFYDFWSFSQRGDIFRYSVESPNYVRAGGWMYHTPVYDELLMNYGCYDLVEAIKNQGNVYYLVNEARLPYVTGRLNAYYSSIQESIVAIVVDEFSTVYEKVYVLRLSDSVG